MNSSDNEHETAIKYAQRIRNGIEKKSKQNKNNSTFLIFIVLFSTVLSPVLILISDCDIISKYIPAFLTAGAALASYWIQLRKPQERWVLYRTAQREIEFEIDQFQHNLGEYTIVNKEMVLADNVSKRALKLHYEWMPFVPRAEEITKINKGGRND